MSCRSNQRVLCGECSVCLDRSVSAHPKFSQWCSYNELDPFTTPWRSSKEAWFNCNKCGHDFERNIRRFMTGERGKCPYCESKMLCDCEKCYKKSFASHAKAKYWSENNPCDPSEVFTNSGEKFLFNCDCGHEFDSVLADVTRLKNPQWCGYCSNPIKRLCSDSNCQQCFNNSFANHNMASKWSSKNKISPREAPYCSNKYFWFDCECGHSFKSNLNNIVNAPNDEVCPYCSLVPKKMCLTNCDYCYNRSFASTNGAKYWSSKNNQLHPRQLFKYSNQVCWFKCSIHGLYETSVKNTVDSGGCPFCVNKTEGILKEFLEKKYEILTQNRFDWCVNQETNYKLPFDFYIPERNVLIELDGAQHFRQIAKWKDPDSTRYIDVFKMKQATDNGIRIIRLLQEDVINTRLDDVWQQRLIEAIESEDLVTYITCKEKDKDIYECHQEELEYELKET